MKRVLHTLIILICFFTVSPVVFADDSKYYYLLSNPLEQKIKLGVVDQSFHYGSNVGYQALKLALLTQVTGSAWIAGAIVAVDLPWSIPSLKAASNVHLLLKRNWHENSMINELAKISDIAKVHLFSVGHVKAGLVLDTEREQSGFVVLETEKPLPSDPSNEPGHQWKEKWGKPIAISSLDNTKIRFQFANSTEESRKEWTPTLKQLFEKEPIPADVLESWKSDLKMWNAEYKQNTPLQKRLANSIMGKTGRDLKVEATFISASGEELPMGSILTGKSIPKLLGTTLVQSLYKGVNDFLRLSFAKKPSMPLKQVVAGKNYPRGCLSTLRTLIGL